MSDQEHAAEGFELLEELMGQLRVYAEDGNRLVQMFVTGITAIVVAITASSEQIEERIEELRLGEQDVRIEPANPPEAH
jgi:hypothetical protein